MSSKKLSNNDLRNLNHYYLTKLELCDFRATSRPELLFINRQLKECFETIQAYLD